MLFRSLYTVVRTSGDAGALASRVRHAVAGLDPDLPVPDPHPMSYYIEGTLAPRRLANLLSVAFAALALVLAAVGIYGVMSLNVRRRSREFAIRLAVGAEPGDLLRSVLRQALRLAALGAAAGVLGAVAVTRLITGMLFEVSPTDPLVFAALPVALVTMALGACWLPAWRAGRSDPLVALRQD